MYRHIADWIGYPFKFLIFYVCFVSNDINFFICLVSLNLCIAIFSDHVRTDNRIN